MSTKEPHLSYMKRLFISLLTLCLFAAPMFAQVVFSTEFLTKEDFNEWTVVDVNSDQKTWTFDETADPRVFYPYHGTNGGDDWLISPAITPETSGMFAISFVAKGSSYGEKLEVFYGNSATSDAMTNRVCDVLQLSNDLTTHLYLINVTANEPIYIGFHACSDADKWRLSLASVTVQATSNPVDIQVSEFLSPADGFGLDQETVTVKVQNVGGVDVNTFDIALSVDDNVIATETINETLAVGGEMEYTFTAKADLSTPRKSFTLKAWTIHSDDVNTANDSCYTKVLHKAPATVPYFMGFEASEYTDGITFFDLNEDEGNWDLYTDPWWSMAHTGDYCLAYNYDKYNNGNDWAILEPITIEEAGYYVLKFWYSGDDTHPEKLGVYYGTEGTPDAMVNKIVEYAPFARSAYDESISIFYIDAPQTIYIGFYAFSDKDENWLCVDDVSLEKVSSENPDLATFGITNPTEYVHAGSKNAINFAIRSLGITDVEATIRAKINESVIYEENVTILAQEIKNFEVANAFTDLAEGIHTLVVEVTSEKDNNIENNTDTLQFRVMGTPSAFWDFEDGQLPAEFTFRAEDEGTINPSAGSEFNEAGWGIFNIQQHELYGEHMLAATSWLDGTEQADRWCVLPPFCPSGESFLVWDVASFNPAFLETYSIMVSTNGDDSWYYFTEEEFVAETPDFKTRGVDLSSYSDTIYVAIRLRSKNCEHLILDNIGLYGGELAGVKATVGNDSYRLMVESGRVTVMGVETETLKVYDMSGREVASVNGNTIEGLAMGAYIIRVKTTDNVYTSKIIMR